MTRSLSDLGLQAVSTALAGNGRQPGIDATANGPGEDFDEDEAMDDVPELRQHFDDMSVVDAVPSFSSVKGAPPRRGSSVVVEGGGTKPAFIYLMDI